MNHFTLVDERFPSPNGMDTAVSHAILSAVSAGEIGGILRLFVPEPVVAFGLADRVSEGYRYAVRAARAHGFDAVERLAGGRAAVFHENTLAFAWTIPDPEPKTGIRERFLAIASLMAQAFDSLGLDARIGPLPGEYCPGDWSINIGGRVKVMGVGQRLAKRAVHVGGVVVVDEGHRIRDVLIPVYRSLEIDWDPRTAGSLAERAPGLRTDAVANAIIDAFADRYSLEAGVLPDSIIKDADALVERHLPEVA